MKIWTIILLVVLNWNSMCCNAHGADEVFPFVLPWDDASPGLTDLAPWQTKPAGKNGRITVGKDGHFYAGTERVRFLGVNMCFSGTVPEKKHAEVAAKRMAKFGINVVRFHHMETSTWPNGIRLNSNQTTGHLAPEALDRLDYFISQLKANGIYANINLLVGRPFKASEGLPAEIDQMDWKDRHIPGFFNARHQALQKEFASKLLTHVNPYTHLSYAEDPGVAFVEINNENGLVHAWLGREVDKMPAVFRKDLENQWNHWLQQKYNTTTQLKSAWNALAEPLGGEMLQNGDCTGVIAPWNQEQHAPAQMKVALLPDLPEAVRSRNSSAKSVQITVLKTGQETWHLQMNQGGLKLHGGKRYTLSFWAKADSARAMSVTISQAHEPWHVFANSSPTLSTQWQPFKLVFVAPNDDANARVSFSSFGTPNNTVSLAGISLKPGGIMGMREGEQLEAHNLPLFETQTFRERTSEAQRDWMRFLQATEDHYWQTLFRFIKDDLKCKALITGSIVGCSPINLMAKMDWVDTHSYWQHPHFPGKPWDSDNWIMANKTMVNERGGILPGLALKRVVGKPHAVTEYNHSSPNTYSSEGFLLLAAYAALQDWDAVYAFAYSHSSSENWNGQRIGSFFDIDQHPAKMATLIPAAAMFRRGDVSSARQLLAANISWNKESELLCDAHAWSLVDGSQAGLPREAALVHRVAVATEGIAIPVGSLTPEKLALDANTYRADTGELTWDLANKSRGVVTVNTPASKAVIGYGCGKSYSLGNIMIEPRSSVQDGWCAITVTAMDKSVPSARWLVTATGYADNTDMIWKNAEKNSVGRNWGKAPSRVEGIQARLTFPNSPGLKAWSLDERGQRRQEIPLDNAVTGKASLKIGPEWKTLWYEVGK